MSVTITETNNTVSITGNYPFNEAQVRAAIDPTTYFRLFTDGYSSGGWTEVAGAGTAQIDSSLNYGFDSGSISTPNASLGIVQIAALSNTTANAGYSLQTTSTTSGPQEQVGSMRYSFRSRCAIEIPNGTADLPNIRFGIGLWNNRGASPTDAIMFRVGTINGITTSNANPAYYLTCTVINGGVMTDYVTSLNMDYVSGSAPFYDLRIEINAAGTEVVFKNGSTVLQTVTSGIPTASMYAGAYVIKSNTSAQGRLHLDYLSLEKFPSR